MVKLFAISVQMISPLSSSDSYAPRRKQEDWLTGSRISESITFSTILQRFLEPTDAFVTRAAAPESATPRDRGRCCGLAIGGLVDGGCVAESHARKYSPLGPSDSNRSWTRIPVIRPVPLNHIP